LFFNVKRRVKKKNKKREIEKEKIKKPDEHPC
jgi:hypothetical protein